MTKFCMWVDIQDLITYATFCDDRLRGLGVAVGRISRFPIELRRRPYNTLTLPCERVILTALFGMRHLTYGTNFLHLFAFLISWPPQSTLLHCQAPTLLLNLWLACLTGSSILVLKLTFSPDPFPVTLPLSLVD